MTGSKIPVMWRSPREKVHMWISQTQESVVGKCTNNHINNLQSDADKIYKQLGDIMEFGIESSGNHFPS